MNAGLHPSLKRLPLHSKHLKLNARIGTFGVWEVPLYYSSILEEHRAVRQNAGVFDISHMGEFLVTGKGALDYLNDLLPRDLEGLKPGKAIYAPLINEAAGILDDIIVYKLAQDRFYIIVNADNVERDYQWFYSFLNPNVSLENLTDDYGLFALQGPESEIILQKIVDLPLSGLAYYSFLIWKEGMVARTGYTGEDGFEIMIPNHELSVFLERLLEAGKDSGLRPAGFGARDTLRLEAGMPLYGHDMDEEKTPLEAGLDWALDLTKVSFMGREALMRRRESGIKEKLIGFRMLDRGIPREGYEIFSQDKKIGQVTSGSFAPTLQENIGMGYVESATANIGRTIKIIIREKPLKAEIVKLPFYKRIKKT